MLEASNYERFSDHHAWPDLPQISGPSATVTNSTTSICRGRITEHRWVSPEPQKQYCQLM